MTVLALDLAGPTMAAGLVDEAGVVIASGRRTAPAGEGAGAVWEALVALAEGVFVEAGLPVLQGIGVSCDGPAEWPAERVSPTHLPDWVDFPLAERLEQRHVGVPVQLHHPALCFTVAEQLFGAGKGAANVLGVLLSGRVAGGLVLGGRPVEGGTGNAGNIGHLVVDPVGAVCTCGGIGCLDAVAGGDRVVGWAREHGWIAGASAGGPELAASARSGDPVAAAALALAGTAVGVAISSTAALLDLDLVVVGGGLAEAGEILLGPMRRAVERHLCVPYGKRLEVLPSGVGQHVGLVGAAALLRQT